MEFPLQLAAKVERNVLATLAEAIGADDLTALLTQANRRAESVVLSREDAVLVGGAWFEACFLRLDPTAHVCWRANDGNRVVAGAILCDIAADTRAQLSADSPAHNFLKLLSGTPTVTRRNVDAIAGTSARIVDTRKTLPGLLLANNSPSAAVANTIIVADSTMAS